MCKPVIDKVKTAVHDKESDIVYLMCQTLAQLLAATLDDLGAGHLGFHLMLVTPPDDSDGRMATAGNMGDLSTVDFLKMAHERLEEQMKEVPDATEA